MIERRTYRLMNPYPLLTLNHLTVPETLVAGREEVGED